MLSHAFCTRVEGALQLARWSERGELVWKELSGEEEIEWGE